jgi:hypothetical protein
MLGKFVVRTPRPSQLQQGSYGQEGAYTQPQQGGEEDGSQKISIPVLVQNSKLFDFDVFNNADGTFNPITEERISSALFEGSAFVSSGGAEGKMETDDASFQTDTPSTGMAGTSMGMKSKESALKLVTSIPIEERRAFVAQAEADPWLATQLKRNPALAQGLTKIATLKAQPKPDFVIPKEVQASVIEKIASGYRLWAVGDDSFTPVVAALPNAASSALPGNVIIDAIEGGASLVSSKRTKEKVASLPIDAVTESGVYEAIFSTGEKEKVAVFSNVQRLSGRATNTSLCVWEGGSSLQSQIVGTQIKSSGFLKEKVASWGNPVGPGDYALHFRDGGVSEPVKVKHIISEDGKPKQFLFSDSFGREGTFIKTAAVKVMSAFDDNSYLIPDDVSFIPLPSFGSRELLESAEQAENTTSLEKSASRVTIVADGGSWSFSGKPVEKLAFGYKNHTSYPMALLVMGSLGITPSEAKEKLAEAKSTREAEVYSEHVLQSDAVEASDPSIDEFATELALDLRTNLVKEAAAAIDDMETMDTVLSLGFVTPENINGFIEFLPTYEETLGRLCELLLSTRIGIKDVPESAVASCVKSLTRVIDGLNRLKIRSSYS